MRQSGLEPETTGNYSMLECLPAALPIELLTRVEALLSGIIRKRVLVSNVPRSQGNYPLAATWSIRKPPY